ncbi:MAG: NapC/NirT family cytochrome c [Magnetococcales bacterium]|nr:NapC/NirT family cytochrome c [Magnetococcales bacterium]
MIKSLWNWLWKPSPTALGILLIVGFVGGVIFFASFHFIMQSTNSMDLCVSCHEMEGVYKEYKESVHYKNPAGVRATCADCHVPHDKGVAGWLDKVYFKVTVGVKDIWHHAIGTYPTEEDFEKDRYRLAQRVIEDMRHRDSKECRYCHSFEAMDVDEQGRSASKKHKRIMESSEKTCIDCHTGVAHEEPDEPEEE